MKSLETFIKIEWLFIKVMWAGLLGKKSNAFGWAYKKWTTGHTFRLIGSHVQSDFWSVLRYAKRSLAVLHRSGGPIHTDAKSGLDKIGIYAQWSTQKKEYGEYVSQVLKRPIDVYYFRDELAVEVPLMVRIIMLGHLLTWTCLLGLISIGSRRKGNWGLMLMQWLENHSIAQQLKFQHCHKVYLFGGYENDSPFTGLCFKTMKIKMVMVPSPNPIRNFYQQTIADGFVFTADFQQVEYEKYQAEWWVEEFESWPFPGFNKLSTYFKNIENANKGTNRLAFMSRGMWKRAEQGLHSQNDNKDLDYEMNCMSALKSFLQNRNELELLICPHPIEKQTSEDWEKTKEYYQSFFGSLKLVFPESRSVNSYQLFEMAEVSVASVSSVNIERLFCGYKTLYAPIGAEVEFFGHSALDQVVARSETELHLLLEKAFACSDDEFFSSFQLAAYHHRAFSDFLK